MPTEEDAHETAQHVVPDARVVYVDHGPIVLAHGRAILAGNQNISVTTADLTNAATD